MQVACRSLQAIFQSSKSHFMKSILGNQSTQTDKPPLSVGYSPDDDTIELLQSKPCDREPCTRTQCIAVSLRQAGAGVACLTEPAGRAARGEGRCGHPRKEAHWTFSGCHSSCQAGTCLHSLTDSCGLRLSYRPGIPATLSF